MRAALPALAVLILGLASPRAHAEPERKLVETRLSGYEHAFSGEDLVALGPGADKTLTEIAGDGAAPPLLRARAVSALGYARTPLSRAFLEKLLAQSLASTQAGDRLLLRKAAVALGFQGLPDSAALVAPLLAHGDEDVRIDAAIALGLGRAPAGLEALRARLPLETVPAVRRQLEKQIKGLAATLPPLSPSAARNPPTGGSAPKRP